MRSKSCYVFDYSRADFEGICSYLMDVDFNDCLLSNDIEFIWFTIKSFIFEAMSMFIPKIVLGRHQYPKWFDSDIRHHLKCLQTLRRKYKSHPSQQRKIKINFSEKELQLKMSNAKSKFENKIIDSLQSGQPSSLYSYIRSQNRIPPVVNLDNSCAVTDYDKASLFNQYFYSIFTISDFCLPSVNDLPRPQPTLGEISITQSDVFRALISLDPSKAMGCDGISPKVLKHCALPLYIPLHHLFSLSINQHYLPLEWRTHLIKPIHKSGDKNCVKNYRPISLLCIISKVLEKIVYNNLIDFVGKSLSDCQFGFLKNRSTLQQLLILVNSIANSLNTGSQADVIYLDFKKAFDSVAHNELLLKLWSFGITDSLWLWLRAYLTNRLQCVSINGSISDVLPVISGVPQGSILGPLLFLIFVNDLSELVSSSMVLLFADDTKCVKSITTFPDCISLQRDLNKLAEWSLIWNLPFNEEKCTLLRFALKEAPVLYNYYVNNNPVLVKTAHRDLGIIMSNDLQWKQHYQLIISKSYTMLGLLRRTFFNTSCIRAKRILYLSLVRSKILYCSQLWRPHLITDIKSLETVQRRATRFILKDTSLNYKERLLNLKILPLMMEYEINDVIFFVKCIKQPTKYFNINEFVSFSTSNTRSSTSLKLRHSVSRNNYLSHFYFNRLPRLWNSLPCIDTDLSIATIRSKLHQYLWSKFITNFDPNDVCTYHYLCPCLTCSKLPISLNSSLL